MTMLCCRGKMSNSWRFILISFITSLPLFFFLITSLLFYLIICLFILDTELPSVGTPCKHPQQPGMGPTEAGGWEVNPGLPFAWQGCDSWSHQLLPVRVCVSRKLEWKTWDPKLSTLACPKQSYNCHSTGHPKLLSSLYRLSASDLKHEILHKLKFFEHQHDIPHLTLCGFQSDNKNTKYSVQNYFQAVYMRIRNESQLQTWAASP